MANGSMGRSVPKATKKKAVDLVLQGLSVPVVAKRLAVSENAIRNWVAEHKRTVK